MTKAELIHQIRLAPVATVARALNRSEVTVRRMARGEPSTLLADQLAALLAVLELQ
jgi:hypothetical protein